MVVYTLILQGLIKHRDFTIRTLWRDREKDETHYLTFVGHTPVIENEVQKTEP
jgi:hypothetical protein